jgi:hypothetical protein
MDIGSPIYASLIRQQPYAPARGLISIRMEKPECFESLYMRLLQRDPAKGCIDPEVLASADGRDFARVSVMLPHVEHSHDKATSEPSQDAAAQPRRTVELELPAFWAHLVDRTRLWDAEACDLLVDHEGKEVWAGGTWSGGLIWVRKYIYQDFDPLSCMCFVFHVCKTFLFDFYLLGTEPWPTSVFFSATLRDAVVRRV